MFNFIMQYVIRPKLELPCASEIGYKDFGIIIFACDKVTKS